VLIQGTDTDPWGKTRAGLEVIGTLNRDLTSAQCGPRGNGCCCPLSGATGTGKIKVCISIERSSP